jgi:hypothetical protein
MKKTSVLSLLAMAVFFMKPTPGESCSCTWKGPFLTVAREAPLVVRGKILRHHPGPEPAMDVLVLETMAGGILDSGLVVQMGDGMHCRPLLDGFPPHSEWILALNGPGAKPGPGLALSHCGEFWLRVENGDVLGSIDGDQRQLKRMPLSEFRDRFRYPRFHEKFSGSIQSGKKFRRPFGPGFEFVLEPMPTGWEILVREFARDENLARLTPPLHFAPNPREIEGWHLSDRPVDCGKRPYAAEAGPENPRKFIFSPEVGKTIDGTGAGRSINAEEVGCVEKFGQGILTIEKFALAPGENGCPIIQWMEFFVQLEGGY